MKDQKSYLCLHYSENLNNINIHDINAIDCLQGISNPKNIEWDWDSLTNEILFDDSSKKLCVKNMTLSLCSKSSEENPWFLDEFGRIIDQKSGYCLVVSESDGKRDLLTEIVLGNCAAFVLFLSFYTNKFIKGLSIKRYLDQSRIY